MVTRNTNKEFKLELMKSTFLLYRLLVLKNVPLLMLRTGNRSLHILTWLLKHCPLHGNGSINKRAITIQRPMTTIEELLGAVFSMRSMLRLYSESHQGNLVSCGHNELQDSHQPVKTWVWKLRNLHCWSRYQAMPGEDTEDFMCAAVQWCVEWIDNDGVITICSYGL
jgi:hypothetical protein